MRLVACAVGLMLVVYASATWAQSAGPSIQTPQVAPETTTTGENPSLREAGRSNVAAPADESPQVRDPGSYYGWWVLAPAVAAILLAMLMRSAVPALAVGVVVAGYMMVPCLEPSDRYSDNTMLEGIRVAFERYVVDAIAQHDEPRKEHVFIILFTLIIGGMVGVIAVNGGTRALVERVARFASTSRRGQLAGWLAGMLVFFDDYANSMIVGPTMRPMYDRLKISRAKLAYIVDSTAAPVASIALIGTWLGAELGYIQDGLNVVARSPGGTPEFLANVDSMGTFLTSIPYRFYAVFALWMVFLVALTGRDFGPMRRAESRALVEPPADSQAAGTVGGGGQDQARPTSAWLAALPILALVGVTVALLYLTGKAALGPDDETTFRNMLTGADSYVSILYGAISSLTVAVLLSLISRACSMRTAMDGALEGMARMFPAMVILVLAWALSAASQDLKLGEVLSTRLIREDLAPDWLPLHVWMPLIVFICSAGVSFATGSSWATMGILTPVVIQVTAGLGESLAIIDASEMFYASVGSVLAGSVFGDHCSPISDTTVLSSVATGCRVEEHVWTQMPYALLTAVVAMGAGNFYCAQYHVPAWWALIFGGIILLILVFLLGRKPEEPAVPPPPLPPETIERRLASDGA